MCTGIVCYFGTDVSLLRVQYMHIPIRDQCNWLRERIETSEPACPRGSGCNVWRDRLLQTVCHALLCQHVLYQPQLVICLRALSRHPLGAC